MSPNGILLLKVRCSKKKSKSDNLTVSPELTVEHKTHKKKKRSLELASCRVEMEGGIFSLSCELSVKNIHDRTTAHCRSFPT